jgi:hypothetical protein
MMISAVIFGLVAIAVPHTLPARSAPSAPAALVLDTRPSVKMQGGPFIVRTPAFPSSRSQLRAADAQSLATLSPPPPERRPHAAPLAPPAAAFSPSAPGEDPRREFSRDVLFFLAALVWLFAILLDSHISSAEAPPPRPRKREARGRAPRRE